MRTAFGIERWMEIGIATVDLGPGKAAHLKIAVAYLGSLLIELQEPVDGHVDWYRELLPDTGFAMRLHHLGFSAPDSGTLATLKHSLQSTHAIPNEAAFGSDSGYFFADAFDRLGHRLEYIHFGPSFRGQIPVNAVAAPGTPGGRLAGFKQVSYITNDYQRALQILRSDYGFERFLETGLVVTDLGGGALANLRVALAYMDGVQFEVIEPVSGAVDVYRCALPADGAFAMRFHHFGFAAPSRQAFDEQRAFAARQGDTVVIHGDFDGSGYFYVDARQELGHHFEYMYLTPGYDALIPRH